MKQISYILMTTGGTMTLFGAMCEADGPAYDLLIAGIAVGLALLVTGMQMYKLSVKREQERRKDWIRRREGADIVFIDCEADHRRA